MTPLRIPTLVKLINKNILDLRIPDIKRICDVQIYFICLWVRLRLAGFAAAGSRFLIVVSIVLVLCKELQAISELCESSCWRPVVHDLQIAVFISNFGIFKVLLLLRCQLPAITIASMSCGVI